MARGFADRLDQLGIYLFIITQFALFSILAEGNLSYTIQHFSSRDQLEPKKIIEEYWFFSFITKLVLGLVFAIIIYWVVLDQYPQSKTEALLIASTLLIFNVGTSPIALFISCNNFKPQIVSYVLNSTLFAIGAMALLYTKSIIVILVVLLLSNLASSVYLLVAGFISFGSFKIKKGNLVVHSNKIISFSIPLLISSFCYSFFFRIDVNFFAKVLGPKSVSYIAFAQMFFFLLVDFLWSQLAAAITPSLLKIWSSNDHRSKEKSINQYLDLFSFYTVISIAGICILSIWGPTIFNVFLGNKGNYENIIPLIINLLAGMPFLVGYAFIHRILLIEMSGLKFMIWSAVFFLAKYAIIFFLKPGDLFNYSTIISSVILLCVNISLIFGTKALISIRKHILVNLIKSFVLLSGSLIIYKFIAVTQTPIVFIAWVLVAFAMVLFFGGHVRNLLNQILTRWNISF